MDEMFLPRTELQRLIDALRAEHFRVIGPQVKDGAIVFADLSTTEQLPKGIRDRQEPGLYQLNQTGDQRLFAWANAAQSVKPFLFQPEQTLWRIQKNNDNNWTFSPQPLDTQPIAIIGAKACDLAGVALQDKHFLYSDFHDPYYRARRENLFIVAVDCTHPAATCFCTSTGDGPRVTQQFDIAMTEIDAGFVIRAGSDRAHLVLRHLTAHPTTAEYSDEAHQAIAAAKQQMRTVPLNAKSAVMQKQLDERWNKIAERCLACGNCTSVCPSCFCHSELDRGDIDFAQSEHIRQWSSCFTQQHSYIHGLTVRPTIAARYRQWLTHKFSTWHQQYGRSGCVGCGRCMTWCPAAIDVTEELHGFNA